MNIVRKLADRYTRLQVEWRQDPVLSRLVSSRLVRACKSHLSGLPMGFLLLNQKISCCRPSCFGWFMRHEKGDGRDGRDRGWEVVKDS